MARYKEITQDRVIEVIRAMFDEAGEEHDRARSEKAQGEALERMCAYDRVLNLFQNRKYFNEMYTKYCK